MHSTPSGPTRPIAMTATRGRDTVAVLAPDTTGVYSVAVRPGFEETEHEVELAFGGSLARLRALRERWDPPGVLATFPL